MFANLLIRRTKSKNVTRPNRKKSVGGGKSAQQTDNLHITLNVKKLLIFRTIRIDMAKRTKNTIFTP